MLIWIVLLGIGTFAIAAGSIGWVTGTLAVRPRRSVYDLEEAVDFVADRLPDDVTAQVSYDDVRAVLSAHCDYLAAQGIASERTADDLDEELVVISDAEPVAWILGRLEQSTRAATAGDSTTGDSAAGDGISDDAVVAILETEEQYYEAIGAIGTRVDPAGSGPTGSGPTRSDPA